jgi:hypothetical protein
VVSELLLFGAFVRLSLRVERRTVRPARVDQARFYGKPPIPRLSLGH